MPPTEIRGTQIKDNSITGDDVDESTLILNTLKDADGDTKVQVEESADEDKIRFDTAGAERAILDSTELLLNVPLHVVGANGTAEGIRIAKGDDDYRQIVFENDGTDAANIHLSNAENLVIMNETAGKDIQMWVDSQAGGDIQALTIKEDGKVGVGVTSPVSPLHVYGDLDGTYVATIDNDQNTNGHVLKLLTDGNGSGSRLLEMEDGDGDVIFRARADGRFGFGPDGVDSMGAGTFVVGIDNSSHTADIAISQRLQHLGDSNTYLDFPSADTFNLVAGGGSFLKYDNSSSKILINNANENRDTQIMADNGSVVLHVDAGNNSVGIGTTSPSQILTLDGAEPTVLFREGGTDMATIGINSSDNILIENKTINKHIVFKVNDQGVVKEGFRLDGAVPEVVVNQTSDSLVDFRVESDNNTHMLFVDGSADKVGINTNAPVCELDIDGTTRTKAFVVNVRDVNSTSSVQATDYILRCIQNSSITITLPAKSSNVGRVLVVKDAMGNAGSPNNNTITLDGDSSDTIDGQSTYVMNFNGEGVTLVCDGINGWMVTSRIRP